MGFFQARNVQKISKFISNFFNPITSLLFYFLYLSVTKLSSQEALGYIVPILIMVVFPIVFWIFYNVKKGNYSNADVSDRIQRKTFYYFIISTLLVYLGYYYIRLSALDYKMLYLLVLLILMSISNYFIKSSMHTGLNVFAAGLFYADNTTMGLFWFVLAGIVGLSRVVLRRHTISEVFSGAVIALLVSILYLYSQK